jgi:hypothetical protein
VPDPWLQPGDGQLRHDLQLLSDAGIVHAPLTTWPVSWAEISRDLSGINTGKLPLHIAAAYERARQAAKRRDSYG